MPMTPQTFAYECVKQARYLGVSPHYLMAVGQLRSKLQDGSEGDRWGPFRLTQQEWDAGSSGDDLLSPFDPEDIKDWGFQCLFAANTTRQCGYRIMDRIGGLPSVIDLYVEQFPEAAALPRQQLMDDLTAALKATERLVGPAVLRDNPEADPEAATLPDAGQPAAPQQPDAVLPSTPETAENEQLFVKKAPGVMEKLMAAFGLTNFQAAGVLGNIGHECGGFLLMHELGQKPGKGGFGWCQWTGDRRTAFEAFCRDQGLLPTSDAGNYNYLVQELQGAFKDSVDALKQSRALSQSVRAFEKAFEKASVKRYDLRERWATLALAAHTNRLPPAVVALLDPDTAYDVVRRATSGSSTYWLINEHAETASQVLVAQPAGQDPQVLARETALLPLLKGLVPADAAAALSSVLKPDDPPPTVVTPAQPVNTTSEKAAAVLASAKACDERLVTRSVPNTSNGHLACAWAVNEVVRRATGAPIGGGRSTAALREVLDSKHTRVPEGEVFAGCIVIAATRGKNVGHVGILGDVSSPPETALIYSNSSSRGVFAHGFTLGRWKAYYTRRKGLETAYFALK